jgi:hypothetical protein
MIRKTYTLVIGILALGLSSAPVHADALSAGIKAAEKGDVAGAVKKFNKSKKPEAIFRLAQLAEAGLLKDCDKVYCAAEWYGRAANAGHVSGLTHLAILNFNNGFKDIGIQQFQRAARWNDPLARDLLSQMDENVPQPDLYDQAVERQRQQQLAARQQQLEAQGQIAQMLGYFIGCGFGSACVSQDASAYSYAPKQQNLAPVRSYSPSPLQSNNSLPVTTNPRPGNSIQMENSYVGSPAKMCPDGSYVAGSCQMAPDGSYVGGQPHMAPNGSYVAGTPRMAPDGSYVGGTGPVTMCPDGSYVSGTSCHLTPNGKYVGK